MSEDGSRIDDRRSEPRRRRHRPIGTAHAVGELYGGSGDTPSG